MISFDDISFQWEYQGNERRLVIFVHNLPALRSYEREVIEERLNDVIKESFNNHGGENGA